MLTAISKIPKYVKILAIFCVVLAWFFCTAWYKQAFLFISGNAQEFESQLNVSWESGGGPNSYEFRQFLLDTVATQENETHSIYIRNLGEKNSASLSTEIVCEKIVIDGKVLDVSALYPKTIAVVDNNSIKLKNLGDDLHLDVAARESIELIINTNNHSGKVAISVDGKSQIYDLYRPQDSQMFSVFRYWIVASTGEYRVRMEMPRYPIKVLTVANGKPQSQLFVDRIEIEVEQKNSALFAGARQTLGTLVFHQVSNLQKRYYHRTQFLFQLIFAALTTWLLTACWRLYTSLKATGGLFCGKRRVFWWLFLSALSIFFLWLLAFWPGVMSIDSLKVWRAAVLPEVLINDHPLLNVVFYRYLSGIWNNPAIVPISHILMMATLIAYMFYAIYRQGVSLWFLAPFYILTVTSIPIGLYNILLWKDIPFAVLLVFWAFFLCQCYHKKLGECLYFSKEQVFALFLALLALAFTRHNGLIYLAVVPVYLLFLVLVPKRKVLVVFLVGSAILIFAGALLLFGKDKLVGHSNYLLTQGSQFLGSFFKKNPSDILFKTWQNYWGIFDINQKNSAWDLFHFFLYDRFSYSFLLNAGWNDIFRYLPGKPLIPFFTEFAMRLYRQSSTLPFVYFSWNSIYFLVLYPMSLLLFPIFPRAALFSSFILVQVLTLLVVVDVMNWRYYYFAFLGGYMLVPLILLDFHERRAGKTQGGVVLR